MLPFLVYDRGELRHRSGESLSLDILYPSGTVVRPNFVKVRSKAFKATIVWPSKGNFLHFPVQVMEETPTSLLLVSNPRVYLDGWLTYDNKIFALSAEQIKWGSVDISTPLTSKDFNPKMDKLQEEAETQFTEMMEEFDRVD